jgi:arylsulfatase A-like enzyme
MNLFPPKCVLILRRPVIISLSLILFVAGCRSKRGEPPILRALDRLGPEDIVRSPLMNRDPENAPLAEIAAQEPLEDLGTGNNPFLIKKKLHIGTFDFNGLAAVPPTEVLFRFKVPAGSRFEFHPAIRFDREISGAAFGGRRVTFSVFLKAKGRETLLYERTMSLGPHKPLAIQKSSIDLAAYRDQEVALRLVTRGDVKALAFWIEPAVFQTTEKPNYVVLISLDTLRADHLGAYGYGRDTSLNIDGLARDGVLFKNVVAAAPWTLPSHISMMTGLQPVNHGVAARDYRLNPGVPTLAEILKENGFYNIALTGGGLVSGFFGFNRGFDRYQVVGRITNPDSAEALARAACQALEMNRDRNLFLFLHTYQLHAPFGPREPYNRYYLRDASARGAIDAENLNINHEDRYKALTGEMRRNMIDLYDADIRYVDATLIGPLVAKLKSLGIQDRTLIVLTSDHGEEFFDHGGWLHSHSVHGEVVHVPLIIKRFASRSAGRTVEAVVRGVDVMPTICRELGIGSLPEPIDGESVLGLIEGARSDRIGHRIAASALASYAMDGHTPAKMAVLSFPYKLVWSVPFSTGDLAYYGNNPPPFHETEIYDVSVDPGETVDLAAARPDLIRKFRELMKPFRTPRKRGGARKEMINKELEKQLKTLGYL